MEYSEKIAKKVCEIISLGYTFDDILMFRDGKMAGYPAIPELPDVTVIMSWILDEPVFAKMMERSWKLRAIYLADKMLDLVAQCMSNPAYANSYRVAAEILKWQASVGNPAKFVIKGEVPETEEPKSQKDITERIAYLEGKLGIAKQPTEGVMTGVRLVDTNQK